ncbi:aspartic peptidase domain-containing protein [Suillus subaureus]|uniref:Aspartic peptidase domain-containing protein n=1 Tax=Suillus subaureus TaxID=48587 RepID=A0A9P7JAI0_9AGAM|nr:aspartic peptidase domain-containing protein [Suillus subaureus]KAG1810919.1 aspartic peptidase domain-containing protein [Suillus subaureus]
MFPSKTLLSILLIALSAVDASPMRREAALTLAFTTRMNARANNINILDADRAHAQAMQHPNISKRASSSSFSIASAVTSYTAQVGIGSPATQYTLIIDTGSSNTWVGAKTAYKRTNTSVATGNSVSVSYGSGSFSGEEYLDTVTLSSNLVITGQSIGVASSVQDLDNADGILGVGPTDLTQGTVSNVDSVPTVTDNLHSKGKIGTEALGVYFAPGGSAGELTFGGFDSSKTTSSVKYVPLTTTSPSSEYWGIDQSITYGSSTILSATAGIVDTGTTLTLIATDAFKKYQSATGAVLDNNTGLLMITSEQYSKLQTLKFNIGGTSYGLTPNGQIWPRSLNTDIGGSSNNIYLVVNDIGSNSGTGLDFINGYSFLQRFYSVYDTTNHRVGFATTSSTSAVSN